MRSLRIAMAQLNPTVGDLQGNTDLIRKAMDDARSWGADLVTFPEMAITGYPPEDLLLRPKFIEENARCLEEIAAASDGLTLVVGYVDAKSDLYNAAAVVHNGRVVDTYHKIYLPNYGVFDENRYFQQGHRCPVYVIGGVGVGVTICEDIWYEAGPAALQAYSGAEVLVNISASPYHFKKGSFRQRVLATRASDNVAIVAYNNIVGGQDELIFDGNSMILDEQGRLIAGGRQFDEDLVLADLDVEGVFRARLHDPRWRKDAPLLKQHGWEVARIVVSQAPAAGGRKPLPAREAEPIGYPGEVYHALVLGTRDYVRKNGFEKVVVGLSGGMDSSIVATIGADALGSENVIGVSMPSRFTSTASMSDAELLAENLGIRLLTIPIEKVFRAYLDTLSEVFKGASPGVAEENLQARTRGNILMALSNKFGWLVLTTGNKSEMATGYATLYGDMAGGFAVLKDVPKTMVYQIGRYRNSLGDSEVIPQSVMEKPPSAELRPNQLDTDTLPPYEVLDPIVTAYVEEDRSIDQIVSMGFDRELVRRVSRLVDGSEYKRRQAPPGIKITTRAFGRDRRLPITNRFRMS